MLWGWEVHTLQNLIQQLWRMILVGSDQWQRRGVEDSTPVRGVPYEPPALLWGSAEPRMSQILYQLPAEFIPLTLEETNPITHITKRWSQRRRARGGILRYKTLLRYLEKPSSYSPHTTHRGVYKKPTKAKSKTLSSLSTLLFGSSPVSFLLVIQSVPLVRRTILVTGVTRPPQVRNDIRWLG